MVRHFGDHGWEIARDDKLPRDPIFADKDEPPVLPVLETPPVAYGPTPVPAPHK